MSVKRSRPPQTPPSSSRSQKLEQALEEVRKIKRQQQNPAGGGSGAKSPKSGKTRHILPDAPPPQSTYRDLDGLVHSFPESGLKRLVAQILTQRRKHWRYRPFPFPLFTPAGREQEFHFDFYLYDNMNTITQLILVVPSESRELWDRLGRFKRQYSMYNYQVWTPEKISEIYQGKRIKF